MKENIIIIGSIDFDNYYEEDYSWEITGDEYINEHKIGKADLKSLGTCDVIVWLGKEGQFKPHCHIKVKDEHDICIRLDKAEMFIHGNNDNVLSNSKEKKAFNEFMNKKRKDSELTNWEYAVKVWNEAYKNNKVDINKMPNYLKLK